LIKCYCPTGGLVLEPFAGSGNFAKTCIKQNKKFLGAELDKDIFDYCMNNINEVNQSTR
jgi:DNA modification methylase